MSTVNNEDEAILETGAGYLDPEEVRRQAHLRQAATRRQLVYRCTNCGRELPRGDLKVKRVQFLEMGANGRVIKTRVVGWLCIVPADDGGPSCLERDEAWTRRRGGSWEARNELESEIQEDAP